MGFGVGGMQMFVGFWVCLALGVRCVVAVNYVDCSSSDPVAKIDACRSKYSSINATNPATACSYYSQVSACVPGVCCGDDAYARSLLDMKTVLRVMNVTCSVGCDSSVAGTDSCDSFATNKIVGDCFFAAGGAESETSCAYYTRVAACVPPTCCKAKSYALTLAFYEARLNKLGVANCKMVCGPKTGDGVRVPGNTLVGIVVAVLSTAFFIQ